MANTFDEAASATEDMFSDAEQMLIEDAQPAEESTSAVDQDTESSAGENSADANQDMLNDAVQTAETAAQAAADSNGQLQQALQELEMLRQQNTQMQGTIDELSRRNEQNIVEDALEPPILDVNALAFADEDTVKAAQAKYAADMYEFNKNQIMKELSPTLEYAKQGMLEKEKKEAISALSQVPELAGIDDMLPQLDKIISNNRWLRSDDMPIEDRYINAYAIARGVNSINTPSPTAKEPTTEELMQMYNSNPEFQEMVEKQRIEQIKQSQQVPQFSASSGAVNAALDIKDKPQTFEDASERTRMMFGAM